MGEFDEEVVETDEPEEGETAPQDEEEEEIEEEEAPEPEEEPAQQGYMKRINKLTWQREEARREAAAAREMAAKLEAALGKVAQDKPPEPAKPNGPPLQEDFDNDQEWIDAYTNWKFDQREQDIKRAEEENKKRFEEQRDKETFAETAYRVNQAGAKKYADYEDVVFSIPIDQYTARAIFETGAPEDVVYYLGKHPDIAEKIAGLSTYKRAVEIGKIEANLSKPKKKSTSAPPPISPVRGKSEPAFDPDELLKTDPRKWIQLRNEGKI